LATLLQLIGNMIAAYWQHYCSLLATLLQLISNIIPNYGSLLPNCGKKVPGHGKKIPPFGISVGQRCCCWFSWLLLWDDVAVYV